MSKIDDLIEQISDDVACYGAYYGDKLEDLLEQLHAVRKEHTQQIQELQGERLVPSAEIETRGGVKRMVKPGDIVLYTNLGGVSAPAMVFEICGFPVGKVGMRVFGKSASGDAWVFAQFHDEPGFRTYQDTWKWAE